jgi:hypothetical protein
VAQRRAGAGGEHRRRPTAANAEYRVTDRVHAAVDPMKVGGRGAIRDRLLREPEGGELASGDDAVLPLGEGRDPPPHGKRGAFHRTLRWNSPHSVDRPVHVPSIAGRGLRVRRSVCRFSGGFATPPSRRC